jgi:eukaryotic-like serine/threonine-protein kinase
MGLAPGSRLGAYEVIAAIGHGGMGEVYRARDTRLKRDVALKILPDSFATDPERLARFQREAEVLASLNHPHIAAIYGLEESAGTRALVMELVEGPTLADRITQGPLPVDEVLSVAKQIAEAVEAAHEQGIIHRDLKPANIKLRADGVLKVLDFGLAKALEPVHAAPDASQSPTITSPAMTTGLGVILGTAAYMSPEQARGRPADKRSDVWAFGCVVYEMLTGRRPFEGDDVTDTLAAILMREPEWTALPSAVPPLVRTLVQSCLVKDRRRRVADLSAALFVLEKGAMPGPQDAIHILKETAAAQTTAAVSEVRAALVHLNRRRVIQVGASAVLATAIIMGIGIWFWFGARSAPPAVTVRFQIPPPGASAVQMFTLSPDGRYLAFITDAGRSNQLWVRAMDTLESRPLAGTDGATYPFWSPDGTYVGFFAQGKLRKVATGGGPPQTLCDAADGRGGTWNRDGVILFSTGPAGAVQRVSTSGGIPTPVTKLAEKDEGHRFPAFLPDGVHFLFNATTNNPRTTGVYAASLNGSAPVRLLPDVTNAVYVPARVGGEGGYLLFRRETTLMAQPFNSVAMALSGELFPIAGEVPSSGNNGFGAFSVAENGTLVYRTGGPASNRELVWVDVAGKRIGTVTQPGPLQGSPAISPDGRVVAIRINSGSQADIWLQDMNRDVSSRLTFGPGLESTPVWSPDGSRLAFASQPLDGGGSDLLQKPFNGNSPETLLLKGGVNAFSEDWSSDGKWLVYRQTAQATALDLWLLPLEGDPKPIPYLQTPFNETIARFAPGLGAAPRWMAYQSNESGGYQVYIQAIPASGAKYQVSTSGGTLPMWRRDGKALYYLSTDQKLMAVPVTLGASAELGRPQELFTMPGITGYAPAADGQRFLVNIPAGGEATAAPPITVVLNWTAGLTR